MTLNWLRIAAKMKIVMIVVVVSELCIGADSVCAAGAMRDGQQGGKLTGEGLYPAVLRLFEGGKPTGGGDEQIVHGRSAGGTKFSLGYAGKKLFLGMLPNYGIYGSTLPE